MYELKRSFGKNLANFVESVFAVGRAVFHGAPKRTARGVDTKADGRSVGIAAVDDGRNSGGE